MTERLHEPKRPALKAATEQINSLSHSPTTRVLVEPAVAAAWVLRPQSCIETWPFQRQSQVRGAWGLPGVEKGDPVRMRRKQVRPHARSTQVKNNLAIETTLLEVFVYNSRWRPISLEAPPPPVLVTSSFDPSARGVGVAKSCLRRLCPMLEVIQTRLFARQLARVVYL